MTPEKSSRFNKSPYVAEGSSLVLPTTPILQVDLDDKIKEILGSLLSKAYLQCSQPSGGPAGPRGGTSKSPTR